MDKTIDRTLSRPSREQMPPETLPLDFPPPPADSPRGPACVAGVAEGDAEGAVAEMASDRHRDDAQEYVSWAELDRIIAASYARLRR